MQNQGKKRYIVIDVVPLTIKKEEAMEMLEELISLIATYGGGQVVEVIQRRADPHPGTYIGSGKAKEVSELISKYKIDAIIINGIATSAQQFRLQKMYWDINPEIEVWDRIDLILNIFEKHAVSAESKLQIQLAKMQHMGPRMYGLSEELGRQGGGIGTRGAGETNVELMKRHWKDAIKVVETKLKQIEKKQQSQIERRKKNGLRTISIVGYTNAGKTTLFNILTRKGHYGKDALFATLDSAVSTLYLKDLQEKVLVSDTIGFIQNLPPNLIKAFTSTLMESIHADLLIHVVDVSDSKMYEKIHVVKNIIAELGIKHKKQLFVGNKADLLQPEALKKIEDNLNGNKIIFISAKEGTNIEILKNELSKQLRYFE
jgi:GTP-binding protein HflX